MIRFSLLILLLSCGPNKLFKTKYLSLSESPCVDGTVLNIEQAGCESFYWGTMSNGEILKIRCTYSPKESWWTGMSFYAVPHDHPLTKSSWGMYCEDRYVKMFATPYRAKLK
jgi:hypothetical protein